MFITRINKTVATIGMSLVLAISAAPATADNMDVLGQFLQQNFPDEKDPLGAFLVENPTAQISEQAAIAGPLLSSQAALIMNSKTGEVLYQKNINRVMPIASISKLMAAMVVLDGNLNMNEQITITDNEIDRLKGTSSRLSIGTTLTRKELLHLGLMSSENRAIHALGRTYPGGMSAFVSAMNAKAQSLGMSNTRFYEPTGLDSRNVSTASDLSKMVSAASDYSVIRQNSVSNSGSVYTSAGRNKATKTLTRWCVKVLGTLICKKPAISANPAVLWWLKPASAINRLPSFC